MMDSKVYSDELHIKSTGVISGEIEGVWKIGDESAPIPWDDAIIEAFLAEDDIQQITLCSTCIGFVKVITKQFAK